jgi:hypothetical protein
VNEEIKKKWAEALRCGRYRRSIGHMRSQHGYCVLGVLCDLHRIATRMGEWENGAYLECVNELPMEVRDWAGLEEPNPMVVFKQEWRFLSDVNDDEVPFSMLATLVEEQL